MSKSVELPTTDHSCSEEPGSIKKIKTESRRSDATYLVEPEKLVVDPAYNVRVRTPSYLAHIRALADDMLARGFDPGFPLSAVAVKRGDADVLLLRAGNSRLEAVKIAIAEGAGIEQVPVIIRPKTDNAIDQTVDLIRSNDGRHLTVYEQAVVVKRLVAMELTEAEIARRLNMAASTVNNLVLLAGAPHKLAQHIVNDRVAAAVAIDLVRKHGYEKATVIIESSLATANAAGKTKVTPASLPQAAYKKVVVKSAPALLETAQLIRQDTGYQSLSAETRERLDTLLAEIDKLRVDQGTGDGATDSGAATDKAAA